MAAVARRVMAVGLVTGIVAVARGQEAPAIARFVPSGPNPSHVFVLDSAHLLSPATVQALQDSARALQTETAADVAWVTLPTLGGRPIEEAALYIGRTWRIGSAGQPGDPLRNRGLVVLFIPDKTKTAGSNFRIEVGNGLEGTITDSRSRAISAAMRENLRAKHYDAAYMAGWVVAASLVREDFASHGDAERRAAGTAAAARVAARSVALHQALGSPIGKIIPALFLLVIVVLLIALITSRRRGLASPMMAFPVPDPSDDDDERQRRSTWFSSSGGSDSGGDSSSSSSDGGSFGDGGGFSGGGSSDTI
jgi:uncharacterized protein